MSDIEERVQKHLLSFCKLLPKHVQTWSDVLQKSVKCVEGLCNQAEQLRHVERARIGHMDDFATKQSRLQYLILEGVEEQIATLKGCMDTLNKTNYDLKNKLAALENGSLSLPRGSPVARGSATQPELNNLLQLSLDFSLYFSGHMRNINECYKLMNVRDEKSMSALEKSFKLNLKDSKVTYLLALTQYVDNQKAIT